MCVLRGRCEDVRGYGLGKTVLSEAAGAEASFEAVRWTATKLSGAPSAESARKFNFEVLEE